MLSVIASCSDGQNESNKNDENNWPITNKFDPFEEFGIPNSRHFRIILPDPNIRFLSAPQLGTRRSTRIAEKLVTKKSAPNGPSKRAESAKKATRVPTIQKKTVSSPTKTASPSCRGRKPSKQTSNVHQQKSRDPKAQKKNVAPTKRTGRVQKPSNVRQQKSRDSKKVPTSTKSNPASSPSRRGRKPSKQASNVHQQKSRGPKAPKKSPIKKKKAADKIIPQSCIASTRPKRNVIPINRFHF